jgi:hypothetical protein
MRHPEVGDLELYRDKLTVNGADGSSSSSTTPSPDRSPRKR